jgi:hypothetical protein
MYNQAKNIAPMKVVKKIPISVEGSVLCHKCPKAKINAHKKIEGMNPIFVKRNSCPKNTPLKYNSSKNAANTAPPKILLKVTSELNLNTIEYPISIGNVKRNVKMNPLKNPLLIPRQSNISFGL